MGDTREPDHENCRKFVESLDHIEIEMGVMKIIESFVEGLSVKNISVLSNLSVKYTSRVYSRWLALVGV